jgi:cytochrome b involved in lipid metabolism
VDTKVFDLSRFAAIHPGGLSVLLDEEVGKGTQTNVMLHHLLLP